MQIIKTIIHQADKARHRTVIPQVAWNVYWHKIFISKFLQLLPSSVSESSVRVYLIALANASMVKQSTVASLPASVEGQQTRPSKKVSQPEKQKITSLFYVCISGVTDFWSNLRRVEWAICIFIYLKDWQGILWISIWISTPPDPEASLVKMS